MIIIRRALSFLGASAFWFVFISTNWVGLLGMANPPVTWVMVEQSGVQESLHRSNKSLEEIARAMPLAVISSEDQRFMTHSGFAWKAIQKAIESNKKGKRVKGASTISQQTAKNVFLWPGRNYVRKGLEAWFTVLIETLWTKERIIEVYLNVAEMGNGVFGAEAAAKQCFGRSALTLSPAQAALITATLPAPRRFNCASPSAYVRGRQQWVLRQMRNVGDVLDPEVLARRKAKIEAEERRDEERRARREKRQK
jgi:monofunctional glycosyltransferase